MNHMIQRRKLRREAKEYFQILHTYRRFQEDILEKDSLQKLMKLEERYHKEVKNSKQIKEIELYLQETRAMVEKHRIETDSHWFQDLLLNVIFVFLINLFFVGICIIPTDSMKPTFYGYQVEAQNDELPSWPKRIFERVVYGISYHQLRSPTEGFLIHAKAYTWTPYLQFATMEWSDGTRDWVWMPQEAFYKSGLMRGKSFQKGELMFNLKIRSGDIVLVNKLIMNFRTPRRGDPIVFSTEGISGIEGTFSARDIPGSQLYVKRCVGIPGDTLRIREPYLYVNGKILDDNEKVTAIQSRIDGYRGYTSSLTGIQFLQTPEDSIRIPDASYWAMGDNSYNSFDSRGWGTVPRKNIRASVVAVLWPFSSHWGGVQ